MELSILYSQAVEVKLLDKLTTAAPIFLGRKDNKQIRRIVPCQIWAKLESSDLMKDLEEKINNNVEGKDFDDVLHVYQTIRKMVPENENQVAVRIQDGHKWQQVGDFEPK